MCSCPCIQSLETLQQNCCVVVLLIFFVLFFSIELLSHIVDKIRQYFIYPEESYCAANHSEPPPNSLSPAAEKQ